MSKHLRNQTRKPKGKVKSPIDGESSNSKHPVFCLKYMERHYCITACSREQQAAFALTLRKLSQLTWNQIIGSGRHANGYEKINQSQIKGQFPKHITPEVNIIAFRFHGKAPMVGYRINEVFHIIWLDHNFTLYSHGN